MNKSIKELHEQLTLVKDLVEMCELVDWKWVHYWAATERDRLKGMYDDAKSAGDLSLLK